MKAGSGVENLFDDSVDFGAVGVLQRAAHRVGEQLFGQAANELILPVGQSFLESLDPREMFPVGQFS